MIWINSVRELDDFINELESMQVCELRLMADVYSDLAEEEAAEQNWFAADLYGDVTRICIDELRARNAIVA